MPLADAIGRWIGRVEIVLAGADEDLREGEQALAAGDAMRARAAAHRVLSRAPDSPVGLALLADACEAARLDAELALTLEELARRAPSRAEVWVRLARARGATEASVDDVRDALIRALAVAEAGSEARRDALLQLADLDLSQCDASRAELWLERAALPETSPEAAVRRAEVRLLRGDAAGAYRLLESVQVSAADGRTALARGRALATLGDARAFAPLMRAMVLDVPGASDALSSALASVTCDGPTRLRVRSIVDAKGQQDLARWRAAFARAEGEREAARRALREALKAGDPSAARPLLVAAIEDRDAESLSAAVSAISDEDSDSLVSEARLLAALASVPDNDDERAATTLDEVTRISHPRLLPWAEAICSTIVKAWLPASGAPARWPVVLTRLDAHARALGDLESVKALAELATDRARPLRLAIVGEFNAGKSTFINALIGADIAPTGVLPTTATVHHLRYAPDPIARIAFAFGHEPPERIVALGDLRATLRSLDASTIRRVELLVPLDFLRRVEILDTPGFNAPDPRHASVALSVFEEADAAIWLLDATQAVKESERAVLGEARRMRLPIQMLVNKADRLSDADLARVMKNVAESLAEAHLVSWVPPRALSAKKALAGRLGDRGALSESGWNEIESLLEQEFVARHGELKERALRRRAKQVVARLRTQAHLQSERLRSEDEAAVAQAHSMGRAASRIERDAGDIAAELAQSLAPSAQAWARDLAIVYVGQDRERTARDPVLRGYRTERAVAALAFPLARALVSLAPESDVGPAKLATAARALVRAAAEVSEASEPESLILPLARASVATLIDYLFGRSVAPVGKARAFGTLGELREIAAALERGDGTG